MTDRAAMLFALLFAVSCGGFCKELEAVSQGAAITQTVIDDVCICLAGTGSGPAFLACKIASTTVTITKQVVDEVRQEFCASDAGVKVSAPLTTEADFKKWLLAHGAAEK